ncbi:hypothetical protein ACIA8O_09450 [Kitasatospora sp. NPDC051853]|uniref:hypothetical protein n=1 Tax=Kitasatospora sp. NPDC051853 TaxID=3364058 RepID=UPI0037AE49A5
MGERLRAPRRASGRRFAAAAALAAVLAGGLAVPAQAEGPAVPAAGVINDLTGDGRPDLVSANGYDLNVLPTGGAPYRAASMAESPKGRMWFEYQVSHRGSATGGRVDDLFVFGVYSHQLHLYPNDAGSGGTPGHFTRQDRVVTVAKPATCAAGSDCTGYDPTWNSATQVLATDGIANADGMPDLVTVEGSRLWYYPGKAGSVIGAPVQLGAGDWSKVTLAAPGKVGGVPTLWARGVEPGAAIAEYRLELGPNGLPTGPLRSPKSLFMLQSAERDAAGGAQCYVNGVLKTCVVGTARWRLGTDGTLREPGRCLTLRDGRPAPEDCTGDPAQRWRPTGTGALVAADGSCLTALADRTAGTAPCDGSSRQVWGALTADPAAGPGPLPAPFDLLTVPPLRDPGNTYFEEEHHSSPGDLDGDGNPELVTTVLSEVTTVQNELTVVRRGTAPVAGLHRLGAPEPLGDLRTPRSTIFSSGPSWSLDVLYSACASLKVDREGSLVVTGLATGKVLWSSGTPGHEGGRVVVQPNGVLTLRTPDGQVYWSAPELAPDPSGTAVLSVRPDCNVAVRGKGGKAVWSTGTYDPAHEALGVPLAPGRSLGAGERLEADRTVLSMGADGNLVLTERQNARVLWTSGTEGNPGASAAMRRDGGLAIRDAAGTLIWSSGTEGAVDARMVLGADGDLAIRDAVDTLLWSTGTRFGGVDTRGTVIPSGRTVRSGETVESKAGRLVMQPDGNLVLYSKATGNARWSSATWGNPGAVVTMQSDGNLVVKAADGRPLWASGTWTHRNARAVVQDDLDFVLFPPEGGSIWATGTGNLAGAGRGRALSAGTVLRSDDEVTPPYASVRLRMQADGNLVLSTDSRGPVWSTGTWGNPGATATVQADGNVVVYAADGRPLWSSRTWGHPGAYLVVQNDANLVLYDVDGAVPLWATGTYH